MDGLRGWARCRRMLKVVRSCENGVWGEENSAKAHQKLPMVLVMTSPNKNGTADWDTGRFMSFGIWSFTSHHKYTLTRFGQ